MANFDELSTDYKAKIKFWLKNIPELKKYSTDNLGWIKKYHRTIYDFAKEKYSNLNTRKGHIQVLAGMLKLLGGGKRYAQKYSKKAVDYAGRLEHEAKDQTMKPERKENFVTYDEICNQREKYKALFEENKSNIKNNLTYLLLSLYTMIPPLRQEYRDMEILNKSVTNTTKNTLQKRGNAYYIVIVKDKVSNSHPNLVEKVPPELESVIKASLKAYPRKYVLSTQKDADKPIGKQGFEKLLIDAFHDINKRVTVDILRSAYISWAYANKNLSENDKEELAKKMRHSAEVARIMYNKIDAGEQNNKQEHNKDDEDSESDEDFKKPRQYFNIKEWSKKYREKNKGTINKRQKDRYEDNRYYVLRDKILWNLNKGYVSAPREDTVKNYDLKYINGKWE